MKKQLSKYISYLPLLLLAMVLLFIVMGFQVLWLDIMKTPIMRYYFPIDAKQSESTLLPAINDPNIKVERYFLSRCRFPGIDNRFWGAFLVTNTYADKWVQGEGDIRFKDDSEKLLGWVQLEYQNSVQETPTYYDFVIPANSEALFVDPDLHYRGLTIALDYREEMEAELNFSNLEFYEPYMLVDETNWSFDILDYSVEEGPYPRHQLRVSVGNHSDNKYYRVKVTALIFNDQDELVDILFSRKVGAWQKGQRIVPGAKKDFTLQSLSRSGACVGAGDDSQKHALVSVKYLNVVGTPGESLFWIDLLK